MAQQVKIKGKFIVIDGVDGSGKSTQRELLVNTLKNEAYQVEEIRFPQYGSKSVGAVEEYLAGKYGMLDPYIASVFYAIDRFDASFKINSWLSQGKVVIADRYVTANAGHQGGKIESRPDRIKYFKWLNEFEYNLLGIPKPDLNVILHVPVKVSLKLIKNRPDKKLEHLKDKKKDIHERDVKHLANAEKVFLEISELFPNTRVVECFEHEKLLSPVEVHNKVWNLVRRIVFKPNK